MSNLICPICGFRGVIKQEEFSCFLIFQQIKCVKLHHSICPYCDSYFGDKEDLSFNKDSMKINKKEAEEYFIKIFGNINVLDANAFEYSDFSWKTQEKK